MATPDSGGAARLRALRQIQSAVTREEHPTLRACGISENTAIALLNEELITAWKVRESGNVLDDLRIESLTDTALGLLSTASVQEPAPLKVTIEPKHESVWNRIFKKTRSGAWDLVKIALGAVLGWWLKKYFP